MPFGLMNAPKTFQIVMKSILEEFIFLKVFIDDVLIFNESLEDHFERLKMLINKLQNK